MTREEVMTLGFEELETRANEIAKETASADKDMIEALNAELDAIEERKMVLMAEAEERKKKAEDVARGAGREVEERGDKKMTDREMRSSKEYIDAYVDYVKHGMDLNKIEQRSKDTLLTENAEGMIAVPTYVEDRIRESWEKNEIMRRVRRTFVKGNLKIGVEVSASGAVIHEEGGVPIAPEELVIAYVNLVPEYLKKLIEVSHTALALSGTSFLDYLYDEIQYQIVKKAGEEVIAAVLASSFLQTSSFTPGGLTTADIITAEGLLAGDANPVLITTRATAATLKANALSANYGYDPFDGLDVVYVDAAALGDAGALLVDLNAVQCNFPEGGEPRFIFDEFTKADENIVRIIGRLLMACDLCATGKAVSLEGGSV